MSSSNQVGVVLVEEEEVELVDPVDANSTLYNASMLVRRPGRFLKPRGVSPEDGGGVSLVQPLLREVISAGFVKKWPPEVLFCGWSSPTPRWDQWVWKMRSLHGKLWVGSGISGAVAVSTCRFQRDHSTMLGLLECWCPETSTFVLPWPSMRMEATVTLEDVMIMGDFPVLGDPVRPAAPLDGEAGKLVEELNAEYRRLTGQRRLRRVSNDEWMDHHMQSQAGLGCGSPLEHAAFLTLWLSRFVFPSSSVQRRVFPIAARLAMGRRIALAPAVLACLYRDLRLMKQQALAEGISEEASQIAVWAPFHILHLWVCERFGSLRPKDTPHFLRLDEPRAARWRCLDAGTRDLSTVRSVLESPAEFRWRPYAENVDDWGRPPYYKQVGRWFAVGVRDDDILPSLLHCMRAGELVGLDCVERYAPHRVAMQFGLDQDLPGHIPWADANWELTWSTYDKGSKKARLYVSSQFCKPCATERFLKWQKEWMSARMVEIEKIAVELEGVSEGQQADREKEHYSLSTECIRNKHAWKASKAATCSDGEQSACIMAGGGMMTNKFSPTCSEKEAQNCGDCKAMEIEKSDRDEAHSGNHFDSTFQKSGGDVLGVKCKDAYIEKETQSKPMEIDGEADSGNEFDSNFHKSTDDVGEDCEDHGHEQLEQFIIQELEKVEQPPKTDVGEDCEDYDHEQLEQFIIQELEKLDPPPKMEKKKFVIDVELERQKDLEFEREIQQIKAEIAALEEQLRRLQSEADAETSKSEESKEGIIVIE